MERTREHVLACTRRLLAENGSDAVTFSSVGKAARVARQTLYRHWSTREQLIGDVLLTSVDRGYPTVVHPTPETHLRGFLQQIRTMMSAPAMSVASALLMGHATTDTRSADTLTEINTERMNALRVGWGPLSHDEYALITGPLMMQLLVLQRPLTDELIETVVAEALARRAAKPTQTLPVGTQRTSQPRSATAGAAHGGYSITD